MMLFSISSDLLFYKFLDLESCPYVNIKELQQVSSSEGPKTGKHEGEP